MAGQTSKIAQAAGRGRRPVPGRGRATPPDPATPSGPSTHPGYTPPVNDETIGGPQLDRQERPVRLGVDGKPLVPQRVPETKPTPLQNVFIYLSIVVLFCGVIAITAMELGTPMSSLIVKIPVAVGGTLLLLVTGDAAVRIWRSAWAWMPIDRTRGIQRLIWCAVSIGAIVFFIAVMWIVLTA